MNILTIAFAVVILAIPAAYLVWVMWAGYHRQWKRLAILVTLPIAMVLLFMVWRAWDVYTYKNENWADTFGPAIKRQRPVASYYYGPAAGDYTEIEFYELTEKMRRQFQAANDEELRSLFRLHGDHHDLQKLPWRKTPFNPNVAPYLNKTLALYKDIDNEACRKFFAELEPALKKTGSYYALWHDQRGEHIGSVGLFVVIPDRDFAGVVSFSH
jgi:hypothetical protein